MDWDGFEPPTLGSSGRRSTPELPVLIVPPPGIEPGFREWKSRVLTVRRQGHFWGTGGARTRDLMVNSHLLYLLSYRAILWKQKDSNLRTLKRPDLQSGAVAAWLCFLIVRMDGLEPPTFTLSVWCSNQLGYILCGFHLKSVSQRLLTKPKNKLITLKPQNKLNAWATWRTRTADPSLTRRLLYQLS